MRRGIVHVPEGRRIFPGMTVLENLEVGGHAVGRSTASIRQGIEEALQHFPRLKERIGNYGWSLSGGEQQMLAVGRGLMAQPKLLMLDEPSLGLAPLVTTGLVRDHPRHQPERRADASCRAERRAGAALWPPVLCDGNGSHGERRPIGGDARRSRHRQGLSRRLADVLPVLRCVRPTGRRRLRSQSR